MIEDKDIKSNTASLAEPSLSLPTSLLSILPLPGECEEQGSGVDALSLSSQVDPILASEKTLDEMRVRAKADLYFFAKGVCEFDWLVPHIHGPLVRLLENYRENRNLLICIPRGWLKTTLCSQAYPLWRAIRNPNIRILLSQNTFSNACAKLSTIRSIVDGNALFRALFPELLPDDGCTWRSDSLELKRSRHMNEGTFDAVGTRTQITGRHYDVVIEDDTVAPDLADIKENIVMPKPDDIKQAIGYHKLLSPILVSPPKDLIASGKEEPSQQLVVGTRWFVKDLISYVIEEQPEYQKYIRACREDDDGNPDPDGTFIYPERFDGEVLQKFENDLGAYMFRCLYFNMPVRSADMLFDPNWFVRWTKCPRQLVITTTVDPGGDPDTATVKGEVDYCVVITTGKDIYTGTCYILDVSRAKTNPGGLIDMIIDHYTRWHPVAVGIETVAFQRSLLYWLSERTQALGINIHVEKLTNNKRSKTLRIQGLIPPIQSGKLRFRQADQPLIQELVEFPLGAHDDMADCLAMQLELWRRTKTEKRTSVSVDINDPLSFDWAVKSIQKRKAKEALAIKGFDMLQRKNDQKRKEFHGMFQGV